MENEECTPEQLASPRAAVERAREDLERVIADAEAALAQTRVELAEFDAKFPEGE